MNLENIFSVFSHRQQKENLEKVTELPESFRNRILLLIKKRFSQARGGNYLTDFWEEMHEQLTMSVGKLTLVEELNHLNPTQDVTVFLISCDHVQFLDFIEFIFKSEYHNKIVSNDNELVEDINRLFEVDNLPYHLTNFVISTKNKTSATSLKVRTVSSYPKIILKENEVIHKSAIRPSLSILEKDDFKYAHEEFIEALTDYRKKDYGDCLTKCGSAFESVMKIICDKNNWSYKQSDTASKLLNIIFDNSNLPRFYETNFVIIATIRNKISKSHGAGVEQKEPSKDVAQYSINQTASSIIF